MLLCWLRDEGGDAPENTPADEMYRLYLLQKLRKRRFSLPDDSRITDLEWLDKRSRIRHYFTNVAGTYYRNKDGSSRQEIIDELVRGDPLILDHEVDNKHDKNAIRLLRQDREQIGYLSRGTAARLVNEVERGTLVNAFVLGVSEGNEDRPTSGVRVMILESDPDVPPSEVQAYLNSIDVPDESD